MKISDISIKKPVFATMMIGALLVLGLFSYLGMSVDLMPEVDFPFTIIQTTYPGASAESVETEVSKRIEEVVNEISGVRHITARSMEGYSLIFVEFQLEKDGAEATQEVREKVSGIRQELPEEIEEPIISQYDHDARPIISLTVSGSRPLRDITEIADKKIKPRLEVIDGVGGVQLVGEYEREILIAVNPDRMEALGIAIDDLQSSIAGANMEIPGGRIDEAAREYLVRVMGRLERVDDFNQIIVKNHNGTPIYLSDVARVVDTVAEQRSLSRYNGETAVAVNIIKQSGANVVDMAREAKEVIGKLKQEMPADVTIRIVNDDSVFIEDSIHEILFNIELGTLLAVFVIFMFLLDIRPTIITGLSIPISIIATFTVMNFLGFTINVLTLMGLSLAVGILIDDAIVVVENIYRHMAEGKSAMEAAFSGTSEIGLAVMATTFSIMVVFLPVAFMEGIIGRFFYQFGMTVAFAVLISLFVAFTLTPMLTSRMFRRRPIKVIESGDTDAEYDMTVDLAAGKKSGLAGVWLSIKRKLNYWNLAFEWFKPVYKRMLRFSLHHRWLVILIAVAAFGLALFGARFLGSEFMTKTDQGKLVVAIEAPPGATLQETSDRIADVEHIVMGMPEVAESFVTIGSGSAGVTEGEVLFLLTDAAERELTSFQLMDSVRILIQDIPGAKFAVSDGEGSAGGDKPIQISIRGDDRRELTRFAHQIQRIAHTVPGAIDIDNTLDEGKPEIQIEVDRKAADDLGLGLMMIPQTVRSLVEGQVVTRFKEGDEEYDVRVRFDNQYRASLQDIGRILVESDKKVPGVDPFLVPLNRVATLDKRTTTGEFLRFDRQNEVRVEANVESGSFVGTVTAAVMEQVAEIETPPGYEINAVGEQEFMEETFTNIFKALVLAIIFIYLTLASQYESFFDPFSIMLSLPMALIGAVAGLLIFNSPLSMMSLIGIVMLMGLVTKNAILLIDFVKQQREKGVARFDAILIAGPVRLRPIMMTTFATVFGMLPLALGLGPGAELRAPMARAVIGGIISSALLTLVVVPVIYTVIEDIPGWPGKIYRWLGRVYRWLTGKSVEAQPEAGKAKALDEQLDSAK